MKNRCNFHLRKDGDYSGFYFRAVLSNMVQFVYAPARHR